METITRIQNIASKLNTLVSDYQLIKKELEVAQKVISELKSENESLKKSIPNTLSEKENLKNDPIFHTLAPETIANKDIKEKLDQYIAEINQCISDLEQI